MDKPGWCRSLGDNGSAFTRIPPSGPALTSVLDGGDKVEPVILSSGILWCWPAWAVWGILPPAPGFELVTASRLATAADREIEGVLVPGWTPLHGPPVELFGPLLGPPPLCCWFQEFAKWLKLRSV